MSLAAFDANDRRTVLAYIAIIPIKESTILKVLKGEMKETDIRPEDIELYDRKGGYTLLAESAACHPDYPEKLGEVIRYLLNYWLEQYPDRYIEKIYAQAASDKGDILIQKLFFAPLYDLAEDAYVLDMKRPGASRLIRNFQDSLKNKTNI
ncbi:hypothetical protein [Dictyobacter arantiisoli]|uniref:Uncharacterized protein n=1 Tax=Dictyobacter arantiisoli TaxID=2014874 RepID=A0A5A5THV9_9CHLR|nr:hypothetical protein [Dictyobacter arantiisoli]GCF10609.1 hypothetical protein KDI_41730 [Dictyobacter arantiisoli]